MSSQIPQQPEIPAPIFLFADLHLQPDPHPEQAAQLESLLNSVPDHAHCLLLGDAFNCWYERRGKVVGSFESSFRLFRQTAARGVNFHHVSGNRDFAVGANAGESETIRFSSYPGFYGHRIDSSSVLAENGICLHGEKFKFSCNGMNVCCAHGDQYCTDDRNYQWLRWVLQGPIGQNIGSWFPFGITKKIVSYVQRKKVLPYGLLPTTKDIADESMYDEIEKGVDLFFFGHLHRLIDRKIQAKTRNGRLLVIPSWAASHCYGLWDGDNLQIIDCCIPNPSTP